MSKLVYVYTFFITFFSFSAFSQEEIEIKFQPKINQKYVYETQFYIDNDFDKMKSEATSELTFYPTDNGFKVHQEFKEAEFINKNKLTFSLNQEVDSAKSYRLYYLKKMLSRKDIISHLDKNGNFIKNETDFFIKSPYISERRMAIIKEYINNLNVNTVNFFNNRTFVLNEEFIIDTKKSALFNLAPKVEGKLIAIENNKAIFRLYTEFYTPIRNRQREIVDKEKNFLDVVLAVTMDDGMPLSMRMVYENNSVKQFVSQQIKGSPKPNLSKYLNNRLNADFEKSSFELNMPLTILEPNIDTLNLRVIKENFKSKTDAQIYLKSLNPFSLDAYRNCLGIDVDISSSKKPVFLSINKIIAYHNNNIVYSRNFINNKLVLFDFREPIVFPIHSQLCDFSIDYIEIEVELNSGYGSVKKRKIQKEDKEGIIAWKTNTIETKAQLYNKIFYDADGQIVPISKIELNTFSSDIKDRIPYLKENYFKRDNFLYDGVFGDVKNDSEVYYFEKPIEYITVFEAENTITVNKTIKLIPGK